MVGLNIYKMLLSELHWFVKQTNRNKIEIILVLIVVMLIFGLNTQHKEIKRISDEYRRTDSISRHRLSDIHNHYQKQLQECNENRIREQIKQNDIWLEKFEELYRETKK